VFKPYFSGFPLNCLAAKCGPLGDAFCLGMFLVRSEFCDNCDIEINSICMHRCVERRKIAYELNGV